MNGALDPVGRSLYLRRESRLSSQVCQSLLISLSDTFGVLAEQSYRSPRSADALDQDDTNAANAARVRAIALRTLTTRGSLRPDAVRLAESLLIRDGRLCGVHFTLVGPRRTLLSAVWDADRNELWCYDTRGKRFSTVPTV